MKYCFTSTSSIHQIIRDDVNWDLLLEKLFHVIAAYLTKINNTQTKNKNMKYICQIDRKFNIQEHIGNQNYYYNVVHSEKKAKNKGSLKYYNTSH